MQLSSNNFYFLMEMFSEIMQVIMYMKYICKIMQVIMYMKYTCKIMQVIMYIKWICKIVISICNLGLIIFIFHIKCSEKKCKL